VYVIWGTVLAIVVIIIVPLAIGLLQRTLNAALSIRRYMADRKGGPFQGPKLGSCLTLRNELSKETHVLTKQEILLGRGARVESSR